MLVVIVGEKQHGSATPGMGRQTQPRGKPRTIIDHNNNGRMWEITFTMMVKDDNKCLVPIAKKNRRIHRQWPIFNWRWRLITNNGREISDDNIQLREVQLLVNRTHCYHHGIASSSGFKICGGSYINLSHYAGHTVISH